MVVELLLTCGVIVVSLLLRYMMLKRPSDLIISPLTGTIDPDVKKPSTRICVVTGASGFAGKFLVEELLAEGKYSVIRAIGNSNKPKFTDPRVENIQADVTNLDQLLKHFTDAETVFHFASFISLRKTVAHLQRRINVLGAQNVAQACIRRGVQKLINASSMSVAIDECGREVTEEELLKNPPEPRNMYGKSKKEAEEIILKANEMGNLKTISLRPGYLYAPNSPTSGIDFKAKKLTYLHCPKKMLSCYTGNFAHWCSLADSALESKPEIVAGKSYFVADDDNEETFNDLRFFIADSMKFKVSPLNFSVVKVLSEIIETIDWMTGGCLEGSLMDLNREALLIASKGYFVRFSRAYKDLDYKKKYSKEDIAQKFREYAKAK